MKRLVCSVFAFIFGLFLSGSFCVGDASAWIGTGTGGASSGGPGGGCSYGFTIDCAGVSWGFYKAQYSVDSTTYFPYFPNTLNILNVGIPAECSQHLDKGGGFWHFGANVFGANLGNGDFNTAMYGHWMTLNANNKPGWAPYVTRNIPGGNQWVGPYMIERYGFENEALVAYQKAYMHDYPGAPVPNYIPGDVWGFCYWDGMEEVDKYSANSQVAEVDSEWGAIQDDKKKETGWTQSTKKVTHFIKDCDPVNGCTAKFWHQLKRDEGKKGATYSIERTSNLDTVTSETLVSGATEDFSWGNPRLVYTDVLENKLFPGQTVCETLTFHPKPSVSEVLLTTCVAALGNAQPDDPANMDIPEDPAKPSSDTSFINIKVRNASIDKYQNFQREVYAKPGDTLYYRATYNPVLQYTYGLIPQKMQIDGGTVFPQNEINREGTLGSMFNLYKNAGMGDWRNAFSVQKRKDDGSGTSTYTFLSNYVYEPGSTTPRSEREKIRVEVGKDDVGYSLDQRALTNLNFTTKTTPGQVSFEEYNKEFDGEYTVQSALSDSVAIDIAGGTGSAGNGTNVQIYWNNGTLAQTWRFDKNSDGTYTIVNPATGLVLDLSAQNLNNGTNIGMYTSNGTCAQKWRVINNGDGTFSFFSSCSGSNNKAMDVANGSSDSGANVQIYDSNGTLAQKWRLVKLDNNKGNVDTTSRSMVASAKVPYNFINETEIANESGDTFIAGSFGSFRIKLITKPRPNGELEDTYATWVPNAKYKLELCFGDTCRWTPARKVTLNPLNKKDGDTLPMQPIMVNIPDVPAGTEICVRSAVYPIDSKDDTNMSQTAYDETDEGSWAYSTRACYKVAKKPSLQVWGGNVYSNGGIDTPITRKRHLAGFNNYRIIGSYDENYIFGSWGELGVISSGAIKMFGSGASMGYGANKDGTLVPNPLGGKNNNDPLAEQPGGSTAADSFCKRSPLTFANLPASGLCHESTAYLGSLGSAATASNATGDKDVILAKYIYDDKANVSGTVALNDAAKIKENNVYFYNGGNSSLTLGGNTVAKSTIQVVYSTEDITIDGDLIYDDGYTKYSEMPKLVIYAKQNININCRVNRIDALLIADDTVKTCADSDDVDAGVNSRQLIINGAVIAGKVDPKRTYGAATGANSVIPAEIINYDPSLYMWGEDIKAPESGNDNSENNSLDMVYHKELAPRL